MKQKTMKLILSVLLIIGAWFDLWTTLRHKQFIQLESNPLYLIFGSIAVLIFVKALIIGYVIYLMYKYLNKVKYKTASYTIVYVVMVLIIFQIYAGINNIQIKQSVAEKLNYTDISQATVEEVARFAPPPKVQTKMHLSMTLFQIYLPALLAILSFWVWLVLCYKGEER